MPEQPTASDVIDLLRQARNQAHLVARHGDPTALHAVLDRIETATTATTTSPADAPDLDRARRIADTLAGLLIDAQGAVDTARTAADRLRAAIDATGPVWLTADDPEPLAGTVVVIDRGTELGFLGWRVTWGSELPWRTTADAYNYNWPLLCALGRVQVLGVIPGTPAASPTPVTPDDEDPAAELATLDELTRLPEEDHDA